MNVDFRSHIPAGFSDDSRVWIYQCNRLFSLSEALQLEPMLQDFVTGWNSHGDPVKGYASTATSVRLIKSIEQQFNVQLFDRQSLAFIIKDKIQLLPLSQLAYAVENNFINGDTLYFNNTVLTKKEWADHWLIPVKESWLAKRLAMA